MITQCPGCGVRLPLTGFNASCPFHASKECWELYGKLSVYTLSLRDPGFIHQHLVDSYEAQHSGPEVKPISATFGLIGLYLALEKGYTGRQVQDAHKVLASRNRTWPRFIPPATAWKMTVHDIFAASEMERNEKIMEWSAVVWDGWKQDQPRVRELVERYLFSR